jgi:cytochrome P450
LANRLPRFAYFPFGGGPRVCIGSTFAQIEAMLILATIGQRVRFSVSAIAPPELDPQVTLLPKYPIVAVVRQRHEYADQTERVRLLD